MGLRKYCKFVGRLFWMPQVAFLLVIGGEIVSLESNFSLSSSILDHFT